LSLSMWILPKGWERRSFSSKHWFSRDWSLLDGIPNTPIADRFNYYG